MSVRAYRVQEVKLAEVPSFNLWHQDKLMNFLDQQDPRGVWEQLDQNGEGSMTISTKIIRKALCQAKELGIDDEQAKVLKADLVEAKKKGEDWTEYHCF